jgi:hypothetical protein
VRRFSEERGDTRGLRRRPRKSCRSSLNRKSVLTGCAIQTDIPSAKGLLSKNPSTKSMTLGTIQALVQLLTLYRAHSLMHVRPWQCDHCLETYNRHSTFKKHQRTSCKKSPRPQCRKRSQEESKRASLVISAKGWDEILSAVDSSPGIDADK